MFLLFLFPLSSFIGADLSFTDVDMPPPKSRRLRPHGGCPSLGSACITCLHASGSGILCREYGRAHTHTNTQTEWEKTMKMWNMALILAIINCPSWPCPHKGEKLKDALLLVYLFPNQLPSIRGRLTATQNSASCQPDSWSSLPIQKQGKLFISPIFHSFLWTSRRFGSKQT